MIRGRLEATIAMGMFAWATAVSPARPAGVGAEGGATPPAHQEQPEDPPGRLTRPEQVRTPAAAVVRGNHRSVQVNVDAGGLNIVGDAANEPSLAIDPTDPNNLVIGWRQFDTIASNFRQAGYAYSHDRGATWTFPGVLQPGQFRSDPVLAADSAGRFYYYSLSSATSGELFRSIDKGATWTGPVAAFGGDKEWMTIDTTGGAGDGFIHVLWNAQYTCCAPGTDYTRSINGGQTFQGPFSMIVKVIWGTVDVGPDGAAYSAGAQPDLGATHYLIRASNAWDPSVAPFYEHSAPLNLGGNTRGNGTPNPGGLLGQVWVAVDRSTGPSRGNVYVLASVDPPGDDPLDVMFTRSTDRGATWSAPVRVNDDPPGAWQWFAAMSVSPTGRIDVTWNDTRNDASGQVSEVYYSYSADAGATWAASLPVTPAFDSTVGYPNQAKIGDYSHMISDATGAGLAYAATFNGEQDVYYLRVGDCDANGRHDSRDIALDPAADCNGDGVLDVCLDVVVEICADTLDNDCDGLFDCFDPDCAGAPGCLCDFDAACEAGETCHNCGSDCPSGTAACGDGNCQSRFGEDCTSCPQDCNGRLGGNPANRFCCGDLSGGYGVGCDDPRCSAAGFACGVPLACCGNAVCEAGEGNCACPLDCAPSSETSCADGLDEDCDQLPDCSDPDCAADPACAGLTAPGEASPAAAPMLVGVGAGGALEVIYAPAPCATDHVAYWGVASAQPPSPAWSGQACGLGATGQASFDPGAPASRSWIYFVVVGNDGTAEGSYGTASSGAERPEAAGLPGCDFPRAAGASCP